MILLDTSVLIDALRAPDPSRMHKLFVDHGAAICGITRAEVLHGARDPAHFQQLLAALSQFPQICITDGLWDILGNNLFQLRTNGISIPFADAVIATAAIENRIELWTRDNQFLLMLKVLPGLTLFQEP